MDAPLILHIETAANICSVALSKGNDLLAEQSSSEERSHARILTVFIEKVLTISGVSAGDLDAIAVSKGPGSYTGLRIGVSVTKGIAYAHNIPVIGINTLRSLASGAKKNPGVAGLLEEHPGALLCPMLDARRMEVFCALYTPGIETIEPVKALIVDEQSFLEHLKTNHLLFFGNGSNKVNSIIKHSNAHFIGEIDPHAENMIPLALDSYKEQEFENTAYFEPFYLKDFIATVPKKKVL
ncbi:MAG: tRNA (adenosine(37)-N6)-threonylcarbamoyltransferase complex dimerization subunit type 1 TsaB [Bacteroidales bacterium]|nr:tRNA (adenosine(37)-N6)-threonylcarbamoyltransferase complex dimerization subunit type 1 TsaB [Bacteroidales bacterium]